ncbi:A-agglutinin anchorage subunit-like [Gigantopelta aegis]|uniref:A-agglutinin anchorage subunit-like n=1 Tax=Gigantopelta aegis TaxID=1735272 RepID=UPI001B888C5A|nr:A-agglutinin anchorage subunit-like [Gigantopelta aegis]
MVDNIGVQSFLESMLDAVSGDTFFIGLDDIDVSEEYRWKVTGQVTGWTNWLPGTSNSSSGLNCVSMSKANNWKWVLDTCSGKRYYICDCSDPNVIGEVLLNTSAVQESTPPSLETTAASPVPQETISSSETTTTNSETTSPSSQTTTLNSETTTPSSETITSSSETTAEQATSSSETTAEHDTSSSETTAEQATSSSETTAEQTISSSETTTTSSSPQQTISGSLITTSSTVLTTSGLSTTPSEQTMTSSPICSNCTCLQKIQFAENETSEQRLEYLRNLTVFYLQQRRTRGKVSVPDHRTSSVTLGTASIVVITTILVTVVLSDVPRIIVMLKPK